MRVVLWWRCAEYKQNTVKHQQGNRSTITFRPGLQIDGLISVSLSLIGMLVLVIIAFELLSVYLHCIQSAQ